MVLSFVAEKEGFAGCAAQFGIVVLRCGIAASLNSLPYWAFASLHPAQRALGFAPLASKLALGFKSFLCNEKETAKAISFSWRRRRDLNPRASHPSLLP